MGAWLDNARVIICEGAGGESNVEKRTSSFRGPTALLFAASLKEGRRRPTVDGSAGRGGRGVAGCYSGVAGGAGACTSKAGGATADVATAPLT